jgi:hypothetical protein
MVTDWNNTQWVIYARINFLHQYTDKFGILIPNLFVFLPKLQKNVPNLWVPEIQKKLPSTLMHWDKTDSFEVDIIAHSHCVLAAILSSPITHI